LIAETRKMLGDVSASVNKAGQKFGGPPPRR
jgi:phospholipid/cholesterol/gamma-HCH transport system substrate-binding protein